ncbi:MAG: Xaa-Pro dipeptidase PepQ [Myxococcales bacterium]|nr:Xaa-Pro dipeptidase PepQ [Myxococcales bacterium]
MGWDRLHREHVVELGRRYARALSENGYDAIVIHSGLPKSRTEFDDQFWALRPTPAFQHWLPLAQPDCALLVRNGQRPKLIWTQPPNFWEKPAETASDFWLPQFDIVVIEDAADARAHIHPAGKVAFVGEETRRANTWGIGDANPPSLMKALDQARVHKTAYELASIDEANRIAAVGHRAVRDAFFAGDRSELDLHLLYLAATAQDDPETPYKNIVALGENAATLHHISYRKQPRARAAESLLLDAGAAANGYCSDVTRTYVKGATATASAFADLIARTEAMQQRLCAGAVAGKPYEELHEEAHQQIGAILHDVGIAKVGAEEVVAGGLSRAFFPHGLGHSLGLVCHDVGCAEIKPKANNPWLRNTTKISVDQVFTIEPGIYFIEMLLLPLRHGPKAERIDWGMVDALAALGGIRIEDDVQVLDGGLRNFTRDHLA